MSATTTARLSSAIYRMSSSKIGVVPRQKIIHQFPRQRQQQCCSSWLMRNSSSRHLTTTTASFTTTTTTKNDNSSSSPSSSSKPSSFFSKEQYVHPLSQIVLTHLQQSQSDFLKQYGLVENSLTFHKDGTFTLAFPSSNTTTTPNTTNDNLNNNTTDTQQQESNNNKNKNMIWTWYETAEKKHWLSIERNEVVGSYLMQDNLKSAWQNGNTHEKIIDATNTMVQKVLTENK